MKKFLLLFIFLIVLAGCNKITNKGGNIVQQNQNGQVKVNQTAPEKPEIKNPQEVSNHLESLAMGIPQVQSAHCVIFGKTAVVGINVPGDLPRSRVDNIKYSVAEALRKDPYGVNAIVTADIDLDQRLRHIRDEIRNGRPVSGFAQEMGNIIGRIIPQLPKDIQPNTNEPTKTENENNFVNPNL